MNAETVNECTIGSDVSQINALMPDEARDKYGKLKIKINTLLWEELPAETTLGQAEHIACQIFKIIMGY